MWPATRSEVNAIRNQVEHEFAMQRAAERAFEQSAAGRAKKAQERLERQRGAVDGIRVRPEMSSKKLRSRGS